MRRYEQLTKAKQGQAVYLALESLCEAIIEGRVRFNDEANRDTLQAAIDAAGEESDRMKTPWFAAEYIREASYTSEFFEGPQSVGEHLRGMAQCDAEDALYPDSFEHIIHLPREAR